MLIETSGLADPAPILAALISDRDVAVGHAIDTVLTLVDAQLGAATLERHVEARRQVALADRLLLTKDDIAGPSAALRGADCRVEPGSAVVVRGPGRHRTGTLFSGADPVARATRLSAMPSSAAV